MDEPYFIVEWLTKNMLSTRCFAYTVSEYHASDKEYVYMNEYSGEELILQKDNLDYHITRPSNETT